ncbi:MAG: FecR family protein [Nannocystaceae bacterium]|nr:FecR family protein [Nannocystaceae bacterium]
MPDPRLHRAPERGPDRRADQKPNLVSLLEELEHKREAEGMPVGARNRLQLAIQGHESGRQARWRRWAPAASFVAGAALVLAVVGSRWASSSDSLALPAPVASIAALRPSPAVGAFHVEGPSEHCLVRTADDAGDLAAHCSLVASHMTVQAWEAATVRTEGRNVRVRSGKVLFEVEAVPRGESPVEVGVSHGTIEVVGTRFAVEQQDRGGHVDLLEGKIRFHHPDGRVEDVLPGQRLSWGEPAAGIAGSGIEVEASSPEPAVANAAQAARQVERGRRRGRGRGTDAQAAAIIERVTELRAEKRFGAAITQLRRALRRSWDGRTAQVLSYELGELLRAAEDPLGACEHFVEHQRKYPQGRYASAVDRVLQRLECE